eukprot:507420_1
MASEKPEKPGKLKFNAAMFNPAAMKPGVKNSKLEELKKKRAASTQPLKTTDDQFSRPAVPRRRRRTRIPLENNNNDNNGNDSKEDNNNDNNNINDLVKRVSKGGYRIDDRLKLTKGREGTIRYIGKPHFAKDERIGIDLDKWSAQGHDGRVGKFRYFST